MDAPAPFGVWLREARNHDPTTMPAFVQLRRRTGPLWHVAERLAREGLATPELRIREEAVVAVINALARRPTSVSRARVEAMTVACAMAAVLVPPTAASVTESRGSDRRRSGESWSARSRQEIIIGVAVPMFRTHGFAGVSTDQIGEAAGITGPSVYRYYDSKAAILIDAFDRTDTRVAIAADRALSDARSGAEAVPRAPSASWRGRRASPRWRRSRPTSSGRASAPIRAQ